MEVCGISGCDDGRGNASASDDGSVIVSVSESENGDGCCVRLI